MQKEAAELLSVNPWTVLNWEKGHTKPPIASIPAIIGFLGYDPFPAPKSLPQFLLTKRRAMGWSIEQAAKMMGVDPGSWSKWERGQTVLYRRQRVLVAQLLDLPTDALDREKFFRWSRSHARGPQTNSA